MVELQRSLERIGGQHGAVVAMSYDPVPVLAAFAERYGITYPLLSDEGSRYIRALGLENRAARPSASTDSKTEERYRGLPHPGVIELDENGVVVGKRFDQSHRVRPSGTVLLADAFRVAGVAPAVSDRAEVAGVGVQVSSQSATYHPKQTLRLNLTLAVPAGQHVYVGEVPDGFITLEIDVRGPGSLVHSPVEFPSGTPFMVEGIADMFTVLEGTVEVGIPVRIDEDEDDVELDVRVRLQSCTRTECFPPETARLALPLRAGGVLRA